MTKSNEGTVYEAFETIAWLRGRPLDDEDRAMRRRVLTVVTNLDMTVEFQADGYPVISYPEARAKHYGVDINHDYFRFILNEMSWEASNTLWENADMLTSGSEGTPESGLEYADRKARSLTELRGRFNYMVQILNAAIKQGDVFSRIDDVPEAPAGSKVDI
ncbi:hypothetical protein [Leifsonia sp. Leaf264]|uniref:hypothetical protein n=1 Tax=Leifsonia sp. Leaf264 TaxID=1736314 RepID=UPI000ABED358|nr:hypothetical protein [Leifsonia sp. Leaf264]